MDKFTCVEDIGDLRQAVAEALEIKRDWGATRPF